MTIITEIFEEIQNTIKYRKDFRRWQIRHDRNAPKEGDPAPDFTLSDIRGENTITLSDFHSVKPVVLIFGSFT